MPDPAARPSPISRPLATRLVYLLGVAAGVATLVLTRSSGSAAPPAALDLHTASAAVQADAPEVTGPGVGLVFGTPDMLNVQMDVDTQGTHASDALSQNESETNS